MKTISKFLAFLLLTAFLFFCFTGCVGKDGEIYGQREVLEYVDSVCAEPYHLVERELVEEDPDNMEYRFMADNRELSFTANSRLVPVTIDATQTGFYRREITCDYVNAVHELYLDDIYEVLQENEGYLKEHGWIYLLSFSDIDRAVDTILAADQVYRRELEYNPQEFLSSYPAASVHVVWQRSKQEAEEHETWVNLTDIGVTGLHERQELYDRMADAYAQLCVDGKIENRKDVPERYLADKHVSLLSVIELDGMEMRYDREDNPYGPYGLTTDDYKYCWYSRELGSYMMVVDIGLTTDRMSIPLIIREYAEALGGTYRASSQDGIYTSTWTIGGDTWIMEAEYDDDEVRSLEVRKNGSPLDFSYITVQEDVQVSATFCIGVSVEDFCRLFDLEYEIEEEQGKVIFCGAKREKAMAAHAGKQKKWMI